MVVSTAQQQPPTVTSVLNMLYGVVEQEVVSAAEAMPEDKYSFAPTNVGRRPSSSHSSETGTLSTRCRLRMATFSSGVKCFRSFLIRSLRYLNGRTISPFPTEAGQKYHEELSWSGFPSRNFVPLVVNVVRLIHSESDLYCTSETLPSLKVIFMSL